jgi:hypothetical protein
MVPGDVINEKGSDGAAIVGAGDGPEVLLSGSVPYL